MRALVKRFRARACPRPISAGIASAAGRTACPGRFYIMWILHKAGSALHALSSWSVCRVSCASSGAPWPAIRSPWPAIRDPRSVPRDPRSAIRDPCRATRDPRNPGPGPRRADPRSGSLFPDRGARPGDRGPKNGPGRAGAGFGPISHAKCCSEQNWVPFSSQH